MRIKTLKMYAHMIRIHKSYLWAVRSPGEFFQSPANFGPIEASAFSLYLYNHHFYLFIYISVTVLNLSIEQVELYHKMYREALGF